MSEYFDWWLIGCKAYQQDVSALEASQGIHGSMRRSSITDCLAARLTSMMSLRLKSQGLQG